jgi:norsolorinic acid ketoreductase
MSTTYLITGGNRGIGKGFVEKLLSRPQTTVITLVRDPSHETSRSLTSLPIADGSALIVESYDAASHDSAFLAIQTLQTHHNINTLDIVIANSGMISQYSPVAEVKPAELESHFLVNAVAPILLFQATLPLLEKSAKPKFFIISTSVASIAGLGEEGFEAVAYGMSKVAANYAARKLHFENPGIVVQPLAPGWVRTAMGQFVADRSGVMEEPPLEVGEAVGGLLGLMDGATREGTSGRFFNYDGRELPW